VRGLVASGANLLLAQVGTEYGRDALKALDFHACAEMFMTPTADFADIVLPTASCFEREALKIGFEISEAAQSHVQLRPAVVPPPGEARSDTRIMFDLAHHLGLDAAFWDGDIDAAYREQLGPTGVTLEELRAAPGGVRVKLHTRARKYAEPDAAGNPRGFATPSRKVEFYSERLLTHGYAPLPDFVEPPVGPASRPDLAARFPLVLTCAKPTLFCQSQHRSLPSLRKRQADPQVMLHPAAAHARAIGDGEWVEIETPEGRVRARARLSDELDPCVAVGEHGWWQACAEIGAPGYDPFGPEGANFNRLISHKPLDP
jgi:anaerobic selenocysteine-containing dehydrogenase